MAFINSAVITFAWPRLLYIAEHPESHCSPGGIHVTSPHFLVWKTDTCQVSVWVIYLYLRLIYQTVNVLQSQNYFSRTNRSSLSPSPERLFAPASHGREYAWRQVTCRVDCIAAVQAHGHANCNHKATHAERSQMWTWSTVSLVSQSEDTD